MSWDLRLKGKPAEVKADLVRQLEVSIADKPIGLWDKVECKIVRRISESIIQSLGTLDSDHVIAVIANCNIDLTWSDVDAAIYKASLNLSVEIDNKGL